MRVVWLAVSLLTATAASAAPIAADPPPAGLNAPASGEATTSTVAAPLTFRTTLLRDPPRPCTGPLTAGASPCAVAFTAGTIVSVTALDLLLPLERRLVTLSDGAPIAGSLRRPGQPTTTGPFVTGFSTDDTFIGLGRFDMRSP